MLETFAEHGGNFVCSSTAWEPSDPAGANDRLLEQLGRSIGSAGSRRDHWLLAARVRLDAVSSGLHSMERRLRDGVEAWIRVARSGHLDLVLLEWTPTLRPIDDVLEAVSLLIRGGLIRYAGLSGFPAWRVADALGRSALRNTSRPELVEVDYSLRDRSQGALEMLDLCRENRVSLVAKAGASETLPPPAAREVGDELEVSAAAVSVAWTLSNPFVSSVRVAPTDLSELRSLLAGTSVSLRPDQLHRLDGSRELAPVEDREPLLSPSLRLS